MRTLALSLGILALSSLAHATEQPAQTRFKRGVMPPATTLPLPKVAPNQKPIHIDKAALLRKAPVTTLPLPK